MGVGMVVGTVVVRSVGGVGFCIIPLIYPINPLAPSS